MIKYKKLKNDFIALLSAESCKSEQKSSWSQNSCAKSKTFYDCCTTNLVNLARTVFILNLQVISVVLDALYDL